MQPVHKELSALRLSQQVLMILIFSLVTIIVWIGISLVTSQKKTAITSESQSLAAPLNPSLNIQVLDEIERKRTYGESELSRFPIYLLTVEGDKQRLSEPNPAETVADPTPPPTSDLNSLLPPVTVTPESTEPTSEGDSLQSPPNSEEPIPAQTSEQGDLL